MTNILISFYPDYFKTKYDISSLLTIPLYTAKNKQINTVKKT